VCQLALVTHCHSEAVGVAGGEVVDDNGDVLGLLVAWLAALQETGGDVLPADRVVVDPTTA